MANTDLQAMFGHAWLLGTASMSASFNQTAINSNFVKATSGAAALFKFTAPTSSTLTDLYVYLNNVSGTPGNLTILLYNDNSGGGLGSSLLASQTITWDSTAGHWNHIAFSSPYSVTVNTNYWIVVTNAAGTPASNFFTFTNGASYNAGQGSTQITTSGGQIRSFTTANGGTTTTAVQQVNPSVVMKFGDGTIIGEPYVKGTTANTNNTLERGMKIVGLPFDVTIGSVTFNNTSATTNVSGLKFYKGTTAPGGTTYKTISTGDGSNGVIICNPEVTLTRNTLYRVVLTFSGNNTMPGFKSAADIARFADVQSTLYFNGNLCYTIDNGSGGWTDDSNSVPYISLAINKILPGGNSWST